MAISPQEKASFVRYFDTALSSLTTALGPNERAVIRGADGTLRHYVRSGDEIHVEKPFDADNPKGEIFVGLTNPPPAPRSVPPSPPVVSPGVGVGPRIVAPSLPAPAKGSPLSWVILVLLIGIAGVLVNDHLPKPPVPPPPPPLVAAVKAYVHDVPTRFGNVAASVRGGKLTTASAIAGEFSAGTKPLADALGAAVKAACDEQGNVKPGQAAGLADEIEAVSKAMGGK